MLDTSVSIQTIIKDSSVLNNGSGLVAPIGIKNNQIEYTDYSQINNLLVCGTTRSGKTTFVKTIIASLISINQPENIKLCIFDSMRTDYLEFSNIPYLIMPIIKESQKCNGMLFWALSEAQRRNALLNETETDLKLPDIFIIIDDYAQVAQDKEVQKTLYELLQINHRVKIHIIIVTSIALAKIISTELKVHIPHRITFFLPEKRNSKVVIDQHGAETLKMPGQFIAKFYSEAKVYDSIELSDSDIKEACNISANEPCENNIATNNVIIQNSSYSEDELYHIAVLTVIETGGASISVLQRKLRIGYDRASKLLERMFKNGIIGPYDGLKPRQILITKEQFLNEIS